MSAPESSRLEPPRLPDVPFDRYLRYDELHALLRAWAEVRPELVELSTLGESFEGRAVGLLTLTERATGAAEEKPAVWIDGNIHASELSASTACLYFVDWLLRRWDEERADVRRALATRAFYVCPRVNPDGAEWALADEPRIIRSSTRPWPRDEEAIRGLERRDVDGDGRMLTMRVPDPNGPWKRAEEDARLMVRRDPVETGGEYFRLLPEGVLEEWDGVTIRLQPNREGLDLNRNFPVAWRGEEEQKGAGPYPVSEPEVRNLVDFVARRRNIVHGVAFHTWSGVLLRPWGDKSDEEGFAAEDLWTYQKLGAKGAELTGYPAASVYHEFRYHPKETISGVFDDWLFDRLGAYGWTVEIWSPQRAAGIEEYAYIDWYREHPIADDLKLLAWSDRELGGAGYVDWYPFEHPQLGAVELGGWDALLAWRNPPPTYLEREVARFPEWLLWNALVTPRLELHSSRVTPLGEGAYAVRVVVHNTGWLPSYGSKQALARKAVRGVVAELELPDGAELLQGERREEAGQLEGRAGKPSAGGVGFTVGDETNDRAVFRWVVRAPAGGDLAVRVAHERAGTVRLTLELPG